MRVLSQLHLKGGVTKTTSAINIAYILSEEHGQRVLLVDNDKQGSASQFFGLYDPERPSLAHVLGREELPVSSVARATDYARLAVLPGNMDLLDAEDYMGRDKTRLHQFVLREALRKARDDYDFVVIDNPPDVNMCVVNALAASDDVMIPIKVDQFSLDVLARVLKHVDTVQKYSERLRVAGGYIAMWEDTAVNRAGRNILGNMQGLPMFETVIRKSEWPNRCSFSGRPLAVEVPHSNITADYRALVREYLALCH